MDGADLDITELDSRIFEGLAESSKRRYVYVCDMRSRISRWSKNAVEEFNLPGEYLKNAGDIWAEVIHPEDRDAYLEDLKAIFAGEKKCHTLDYRFKNRHGDYVMCTCKGNVLKGKDGEADLFVGSVTNHGIMDNIDGTTNLYNIYEFWENMHRYTCGNTGKKMTLLLLSINGFGFVNDTYGYNVGNKLLRAFAQIVKDVIGAKGKVYRLDGVRFACCIDGNDKESVNRLYKQIQKKARYSLYVENVRISVTISAGAVIYSDKYDEYSIQTSARYALAQSKHKRQGDVVFFDDSLLQDNKKNLELMNVIRDSIINDFNGFYLCYQPIMDSKNEKLIGAEALLRWKNDRFGEVPPGMFIPWLENDPSFWELGNWILKKALTDCKPIVVQSEDFIINVNIAYPQLAKTDFIDSMKNILKETAYPAENLCLELTERCRKLDKGYLQDTVNALKQLGIKIAIDDFGTGFSSLELLSELKVDTLKIDRAFMVDIENNHSNQAIVKAVTGCADDLHIKVCVEGVEDRQVIDFVKQYMVYSYQGYYFSRPIPMDIFEKRYFLEGVR